VLVDLFILKDEEVFWVRDIEAYKATATDGAFAIFSGSVGLIIPQIYECDNGSE
jgi:hypothetical protein